MSGEPRRRPTGRAGKLTAGRAAATWHRVLIALAIASIVYGTFGAFLDAERHGTFLWDLDYYRLAAARWTAGDDPYLVEGSPTGYFYSVSATPLLARLFFGFESELAYAILTFLALGAALALTVSASRPPPRATPLCWIYAIAFGNSEVAYALATGNLATFTGLLMAGALMAASRRWWLFFYLLIGVASLIKPQALLLLVLPFALGELSKRAVVSLVPWCLDAALSWALWPELAASRAGAIWMGVVEPLQLRYSLAGRLSRLLDGSPGLDATTATMIALLVQLAVAVALAIAVRQRGEPHSPRGFALAAVAALAMLPRMGGYDAFVFGPAVLVAFLQPTTAKTERRGASLAAAVVLLAGLFKEGLAVLPLCALAAVLLSARGPGTAGSEATAEPE